MFKNEEDLNIMKFLCIENVNKRLIHINGFPDILKRFSQFEKYLANYSMSFDLSTISQITGRATNSVSRFASNMSRPVQVGTERLKSYNHDMEGGKRGYTYREKPIMSTRGEVLKNRIKNKLTSFGK